MTNKELKENIQKRHENMKVEQEQNVNRSSDTQRLEQILTECDETFKRCIEMLKTLE